VVADDQALSPQEGRADGLEVVEVKFAGADASGCGCGAALPRPGCRQRRAGREAGEQGLDLRPEQSAGVEVREQMLHGQQRVDFLGREPQARQFILRTDRCSGFSKR
jgi:hypothetical protein